MPYLVTSIYLKDYKNIKDVLNIVYQWLVNSTRILYNKVYLIAKKQDANNISIVPVK